MNTKLVLSLFLTVGLLHAASGPQDEHHDSVVAVSESRVPRAAVSALVKDSSRKREGRLLRFAARCLQSPAAVQVPAVLGVLSLLRMKRIGAPSAFYLLVAASLATKFVSSVQVRKEIAKLAARSADGASSSNSRYISQSQESIRDYKNLEDLNGLIGLAGLVGVTLLA